MLTELLRLRNISFVLATLFSLGPVDGGEQVLNSPALRFASDSNDTPDFQRHVVPLLGKLGCNGRACHGSFQGRGGFRLSLFGYDFELDHEELSDRTDLQAPAESLMLQKPLAEIDHEGGQRFESGSWQHRLLLRWIQAGAPARATEAPTLEKLEVIPAEVLFSDTGQQIQLSCVASWSDGSQEVITELCRFQSNDDQIAEISGGGMVQSGMVQSGMPGDTHVVVFYDNAIVPVPVPRPVSEFAGDNYPSTPTPTAIDQLVVAKLRKLGMVQSDVCTDEQFLRRASLDATGTLPSVPEIRSFVADSDPDKRARKIDELLERPGYAAWWTTRLCDFTGNSDDQLNNVTPIRAAASQHWYDWIHSRVQDNVPWDDIVAGMVLAVSRDPGESYGEYCHNMSRLYHRDSDYSFGERATLPHYWSRRNFQTVQDRVIGFSHAFLGVRLQCAQCHKHPFDRWTQQDFIEFQGFFTGVVGRNRNPMPKNRDEYRVMLAKFETGNLKGNQLRRKLGELLREGETVPFGEVFTRRPVTKPSPSGKKNKNGKPKKRNERGAQVATQARLPGDTMVDLTEYQDIREPLMAWLRSAENPLFARTFVNRVWSNYFHAGIVNPPDDMNLANPPSNAELLDYLASGFVTADFDMKWLHREIMNSRTYQLSWQPNDTNRGDERNFSRAVPRRLPAEISWDILSQATGDDDAHEAYVTQMDKRAVSIPGSSARNRGRGGNPSAYPLAVFGRSIRESNCDCDRSADPSLLQTIFVRNDDQVLTLLDRRDSWLAQVAAENGIPFQVRSSPGARAARAKQQAPSRRRLRARLVKQQQLLKTLRKKKGEDRQNQIVGVEAQIARLKRRLRDLSPVAAQQSDETQPVTGTIDVTSAVEQAWLRTLSRQPTESEAVTAAEFIAQHENHIDGLRDVMWALLNTKEFIVNH